jgi:hypothetical protein
MQRCVGPVRADVSEEHIASIFSLEKIRKQRKAFAVG